MPDNPTVPLTDARPLNGTVLAIGAMVDAYRNRKMTAAETMRAIRAYISDWERDV